ncbi:Phosphoglycerate mutase family [Serinicoccus hydrothermalis]|uniref:Phosphoglycerate mutase family n=1 Tax=Serinicoccus hydrothermalis TaxID=1758689 RepID=A0A1B1N7P8_9MICO|nr:histidine phosphatase family protein [Serinicoccus hydrothermalis]ANS77441.1 Phosphoglycerate mutase family [Serinicoccus hydrothermalis]
MRRVIVWRHGETEHNAGGIFQGQLDTELSDRGRAQAERAACALAERGATRLVASDLTRARQTADVLAARTGLSVEPEPRLREIHVGRWQGLTHAEVLAAYPEAQQALERGEDVVRGETGERVADVATRARAAFEDVVDDLPEDGVAVLASHGLATRALVCAVVGLDFQQASRALVGLRNCHWAELVEHRTGWRLEAWNVGVPDTEEIGTIASPVP